MLSRDVLVQLETSSLLGALLAEVIKRFSCPAQLRLKFILLINVKMPKIVG